MSWDVSVQRFSREYDSVEDIPESERCVPIGSQAAVRALVSQFFPGTDWSEPSWGIFESANGLIEFNMGKGEPNTGFMMHVRASPAVVRPIIEMCRSQHWQALDCSSGGFLEKSTNAENGLEQWGGYRDQLFGVGMHDMPAAFTSGGAMQVIDHEPGGWFLVQDGEKLFLDVNCSHGAVSYDFVMELNDRERSGYAMEGRTFIAALAEKVQSSAPGVRGSPSPYGHRHLQGNVRVKLDECTIAWIKEQRGVS